MAVDVETSDVPEMGADWEVTTTEVNLKDDGPVIGVPVVSEMATGLLELCETEIGLLVV